MQIFGLAPLLRDPVAEAPGGGSAPPAAIAQPAAPQVPVGQPGESGVGSPVAPTRASILEILNTAGMGVGTPAVPLVPGAPLVPPVAVPQQVAPPVPGAAPVVPVTPVVPAAPAEPVLNLEDFQFSDETPAVVDPAAPPAAAAPVVVPPIVAQPPNPSLPDAPAVINDLFAAVAAAGTNPTDEQSKAIESAFLKTNRGKYMLGTYQAARDLTKPLADGGAGLSSLPSASDLRDWYQASEKARTLDVQLELGTPDTLQQFWSNWFAPTESGSFRPGAAEALRNLPGFLASLPGDQAQIYNEVAQPIRDAHMSHLTRAMLESFPPAQANPDGTESDGQRAHAAAVWALNQIRPLFRYAPINPATGRPLAQGETLPEFAKPMVRAQPQANGQVPPPAPDPNNPDSIELARLRGELNQRNTEAKQARVNGFSAHVTQISDPILVSLTGEAVAALKAFHPDASINLIHESYLNEISDRLNKDPHLQDALSLELVRANRDGQFTLDRAQKCRDMIIKAARPLIKATRSGVITKYLPSGAGAPVQNGHGQPQAGVPATGPTTQQYPAATNNGQYVAAPNGSPVPQSVHPGAGSEAFALRPGQNPADAIKADILARTAAAVNALPR